MNLIDFFEKQTAKFGSKLALEMRPRYRTLRWSYQELGEKTKRIEQALAREGVQAGDKIFLFSSNSHYWVAAFFAVLSRGAVVVPLNPQSPPEQLDRIQTKAEPKLLLKSRRLPWGAQNLPTLEIETTAEENSVSQNFFNTENKPTLSDESLAEIIFTSGTTGDPKGVMLTHGNLLGNINALSQAIPIKPGSHFINILPLFHMYAQMISIFLPMAHGGAVTHLPSLGSRVIRETLATTPATHLVAVPEFLKTVMMRLETRLKERHLGGLISSPVLRKLPVCVNRLLLARIRRHISKTLHTLACGGAPLDPEVEKKWRSLGFYVLQGYGLTETAPVISINTYRQHRLGSVGKPLPGVQVRISGEGEILVKGPNVSPGYYKEPKLSENSFDSSWFKTQDGGVIDQDGFLTVFGRMKYMILGPGGENVFPEDIEAELNKMEEVQDSAVLGLDIEGRTLIHAVLLSQSCDPDHVVEEANLHLAAHQQIQEWSLWPEPDFPRSATRKVKKEEVLVWLKSREQKKTILPTGMMTPLVRLLLQVTQCDPKMIYPDMRIVPELYLDSLLRIELVSRLEEEFGVTVEERLITPKTTVAELESLIAHRKTKPPHLVSFPHWSLSVSSRILRLVLQFLLCFSWLSLWVKLRVRGLDNLKDLKGPVFFMPNHKSYLDSAVVLRAIPFRFRFHLSIAASIEVLYERFKWFVPYANLIFNTYPFATHSEENIKPSLEHTGHLVDKNWNILIYPEGLMNLTDRPILPLKGGAGLLAVEMGIPIIPVAILGTDQIIPPGKTYPQRRGQVDIRFGKPLHFKRSKTYPHATQEIEQALLKLIKEQ